VPLPAIERAVSGVRQRPITFGMLREVDTVHRNPFPVHVDVVILELYLELLVTELENRVTPW
jgi:hypothetical protein